MSHGEPGGAHDLERELAALTDWSEAGADAWRAALDRARPAQAAGWGASLQSPFWNRPLGARGLFAALLVVGVSVLLVAALLPSLGKARSSGRMMARSDAAEAAAQARTDFSSGRARGGGAPSPMPSEAAAPLELKEIAGAADAVWQPETQKGAGEVSPKRQAVSADRQVICKATIDLKTADVAATFMKASMVLSEAQGEYIENSSLTGEGRTASGTLTLRVQAARLSEVLNRLRGLGAVVSETASGEDVTDRVVDIEARLRNEQRVETEMLELLSSRKDAPLTEILQLREQIRGVRESIERLVAQRDRLGRLVSLATVLVVIRADDAPEPMTGKGIGAYFGKTLGEAWRSSMRFLADSAALIVSVIVGGAIWWALLVAAVVAVVATRRRVQQAAAVEPVPTE